MRGMCAAKWDDLSVTVCTENPGALELPMLLYEGEIMGNELSIPVSVQKHVMLQLMSGNDVEIRLIDGEFVVISLRKKIEKFSRNYRGENKNISIHR